MVDGAGPTRHGTATVLFTDLVGSTTLRDHLGDDAADDLRREHDQALRLAIDDSGGHEVKHLGDGLMATFAAASDAVAAAVAMQRAIDRLARRREQPIGLRVGVSAGDVMWEGDDCFGTPVVEAKRLCDAAESGSVLVSEVVRLLAGSRAGHRYEPTGPLALKGLAEPIAAFTVPWERSPEVSFRLPAPLEATEVVPYVGRAEEREALADAWKATAAGERRAVLLAGEPGIGKTRLASEVARTAHEAGAAVLFGRCDDDLAVPYQPFVEALGGYVEAAGSAVVSGQLGPWGGDLARLLPNLPTIVPGLPAPATADPETERLRVFEAVTAWLRAIGETAPVLFVVDDLHWAAKPTLLLLRHILKAPPMRLLLIGTYRDTDLDRTHPLSEVLADLRRVDGVTRLALDGLDADEVNDFVAAAAGTEVDAALADVVAAIHAETEGNPFFVGQVLRHLVETGVVEQREGRWTKRPGADRFGIPEGVREVVGRRLGRLDEATNRALAVASVMGREFDIALLGEVLGDPDAALDAIEAAETAHLVHGVAGRPGRWTFNHALVRSTLYEELPTTRRLRIHRDVGRALAARSDGDPAALSDLARHFAEAAPLGEVDRAVDYGRRAATTAVASLAFEEAVSHLTRALDVLDLVEPAPLDARAEVLCDLVAAQFGAEGAASTRPALARAVAAARVASRPDLIATAALSSTGPRSWAQPGIVDAELVPLLEEALRDLPEGDGCLRAKVLARLSSELYFDGAASEQRRLAMADEAVAMARRLGDAETIGYALSCARWAWWGPDDLEGRLRMDEEILELGRREGLPQYELWGHLWRTVDSIEAADIAAFRHHRREGARVARRLGDRMLLWQSAASGAVEHLLAGRLDDAEEHATTALGLGEAALPESAVQMWGATIFTIRRLQGRSSEMDALTASMVETYPAIPAWRFAHAYLRTEMGDLDGARAILAPLGPTVTPRRDSNWLIGQALLAYVSWRTGDVPLASRLHDELVPHRRKLVFAGVPATVIPTVDAFLGVTAATAQRWDNVEEYLATAVADARDRLESPYLLAEVDAFAAEVFAARGGPGDAGRARALADEAIKLAEPLGLVILVGYASNALAMLE